MPALSDAPLAGRPAGLFDAHRLAVLHSTGLLAVPADAALDRLSALARRLLGVPTALVSLVDRDAQHFAGCAGPLPAPFDVLRQTPLSHSFCQHVVTTGAPLVVDDARDHPLVRDNLAVTELGVVAYLGVPLVAEGGEVLGAVCAIDGVPRAWSADDVAALTDVAAAAANEVTLRLRNAALGEARRGAEELLRTSPDAFVSLDAAGRVTRASDAACSLLRVTRHALLARHLPELLPEARFGTLAATAATAAQEQRVDAREVWVPALARWIAVHAAPADDGGVALYLRDVTTRAEAQRALAASERRFRTVAQSAVDAIIAGDAQGRIAFWTPAAERMFGWSMPEAIGRPMTLIIPERHRAAHDAGMARVARGGPPRVVGRTVEVPALRRDGTEFTCELSLGHYTDADGETFFTAILRDVTERKAAEAALRERDARYRTLVESLDAVVFRTDAEGRWTLLNEAWTRLTGWAVDGSLGQCFLDYVHEDDRAGNLALFEPLVTREKSLCRHTVRYRTADGGVRWIEVRAQAEFDGSGPAATCVATFGTLVDVTAQREVEAALRAREDDLRQAQKMEAVGQLAGGVAHDFNNLLTAIRGFAELVAMQLSAGDPRRDDVREVMRAADRAAELVDQLLTFSRKQPAHVRALRPAEVVTASERLLARVLGADVTLVTELPPDSGWVDADAGQLEQVLLNLVVNARDAIAAAAEPGATRVPGTITVRVHDLLADPSRDAMSAALAPYGWVALTVRDTGTGMSAAVRERLFEPFFTTKPLGKGTGLGLATVFGIVTQAGGRVLVDSVEGAGSTFTVLLPRRDDRAGAIVGLSEYGHDALPVSAGETLLFVEDEDALRALGARVLGAQGYRVLTARHGADALRVAAAHEGSLDLLVTDLVMPTMGGRELVPALRALRPDLPVLVVTGYSERAPEHDPALAGCPVLRKPYTADGLARAVGATVRRSR